MDPTYHPPQPRTQRCPASPVQVLVQRLIRILIALDAPHEIFRGLIAIVVDVVRAAQFHLLPGSGTEQGHIRAGGQAGRRPRRMLGGGEAGQEDWPPGGLVPFGSVQWLPGPSSHTSAKSITGHPVIAVPTRPRDLPPSPLPTMFKKTKLRSA